MSNWRYRLLQIGTFFLFALVAARLSYWQLLAGPRLEALALAQRSSQIEIPATRGIIFAADGFPLVTNKPSYLAYLYRPDLKLTPEQLTSQVAPLIFANDPDLATFSGEAKTEAYRQYEQSLLAKVNTPTSWVALGRSLSQETKDQLSALGIKGIGFETSQIRSYPEATMAAQLLGFVGADEAGKAKGYFGLEGFYDLELSGVPGILMQELDSRGRPILTGDFTRIPAEPGRSLQTHIDRSLQLLVETALGNGLNQYQAPAGEVVVMNPQTGAIVAMAALPSYDPGRYKDFPAERFRNPSIGESYEPGSTFKVIVMASALNENVVTPETVCDTTCNGPVTIGAYSIKTWNNEYHPGINMTSVLEKSDNTGMVFVSKLLNIDRYQRYVSAFGFGKITGIDLQGEAASPLRQKWGEIDLATGSFGQGIAVTTLQMLSAVSAIANGGILYEPHVAQAVIDGDVSHPVEPKAIRRVLSETTAQTISTMMEQSALHGEARWAALKGYHIAGKTGTAQIPIAGHYDADKTIASFVGFAPTTKPKFAMIVKLKEPQSSPWAAETAAPLWFSLAKDIMRFYNITAE